MRTLTDSLIVIVMAVLLSSCSLAPVESPVANQYTLEPTIQVPKATNRLPATLVVSNVRANPAFSSTRMIYREQPYALSYFSKNRWVQPPAVQLTPFLVQALSQSNRFKTVVAAPYVGKTGYRLQTDLLYLYQDFTERPVTLKMGLSVGFINAQTGQLIAVKRFEINEPVASNDPYGGVIAANKATESLLGQATSFVIDQQ